MIPDPIHSRMDRMSINPETRGYTPMDISSSQVLIVSGDKMFLHFAWEKPHPCEFSLISPASHRYGEATSHRGLIRRVQDGCLRSKDHAPSYTFEHPLLPLCTSLPTHLPIHQTPHPSQLQKGLSGIHLSASAYPIFFLVQACVWNSDSVKRLPRRSLLTVVHSLKTPGWRLKSSQCSLHQALHSLAVDLPSGQSIHSNYKTDTARQL